MSLCSLSQKRSFALSIFEDITDANNGPQWPELDLGSHGVAEAISGGPQKNKKETNKNNNLGIKLWIINIDLFIK